MPGGERCAQGTRQENGVPDPGWLVLSRSQRTRPTDRRPGASAGRGSGIRRLVGRSTVSDVAVCAAAPRIGDPWTRTSKEAWPDWRAC